MTLEQLRIFVAVAERQHVTQAAAQLNLTQSAVSSAVSALETRHDVKLFDRVGRSIVLNQVGEAFLREARAVLARAAAAETALADFGGLRRGRLSVSASQTVASYWLPQRLAAFRKAWPGVEVSADIANTTEVADAVLAGSAELGFVEGEVEEGVLSRRRIGADKLVVVVGRGHPWAGRQALDSADAPSTDWVLREPGSGTRSVFEAALAKGGVDPRRPVHCPDPTRQRGGADGGGSGRRRHGHLGQRGGGGPARRRAARTRLRVARPPLLADPPQGALS